MIYLSRYQWVKKCLGYVEGTWENVSIMLPFFTAHLIDQRKFHVQYLKEETGLEIMKCSILMACSIWSCFQALLFKTLRMSFNMIKRTPTMNGSDSFILIQAEWSKRTVKLSHSKMKRIPFYLLIIVCPGAWLLFPIPGYLGLLHRVLDMSGDFPS